jgi:peptidoglycan/xylan/chitin deacetylase (PgdA/CDA1 family)
MIVRLVVDDALEGAAEARWTAETLLSLTGLAWRAGKEGDGPRVFVGAPGNAPEGAALVLPWSGLEPWTPAGLALATFEDVSVPCPGGRLDPPQAPNALPAQLLRAAFGMLAREEERLEPARDQWECFAGTQSRLHALGVLERPLVNEYARLVAARLAAWAGGRGTTLVPKPLWPDGARFAVILSHDVDEVRFGSVREALRLVALARGPRSYAFRAGLTQAARGLALRGPDPYWNFERWVQAEEARGFSSSYYFCAPSPRMRHEYDARYRFGDRVDAFGRRGTVSTLMRQLAERGFDVGLHGSYLSHVDGDDLARQRAEIEAASGRPATGTRQHFLRFDALRTWQAQEAAGFDYDSTLGYNEAIGFRAGIAAPFHPWNAAARAPHDLLELPLTVMDGTLFRTLDLDGRAAAELVRAHLETVEATGGLAVLLWHPNGAAARRFPGWWEAWEAALTHLQLRSAWVTDGARIARWWRQRTVETAPSP